MNIQEDKMNIFILDYDIKKNAEYHCDKHIVKMITESCQMISTAIKFTVKGNHPDFLYKVTHINHPCNKWTRESWNNLNYHLRLAKALYDEYQFRYNKADKHIRNKKIIDYGLKHLSSVIGNEITSPFPQAMPDKYRTEDTVTAYRRYYIGEKLKFAKWTKRHRPYWIKNV